MTTLRRWRSLGILLVGVAASGLTGCYQTWVPSVGMTLPSGHYLQHRPQYFAPSPPFPLTKELAQQEAQAAAAAPPLGAPVPPAGQ